MHVGISEQIYLCVYYIMITMMLNRDRVESVSYCIYTLFNFARSFQSLRAVQFRLEPIKKTLLINLLLPKCLFRMSINPKCNNSNCEKSIPSVCSMVF